MKKRTSALAVMATSVLAATVGLSGIGSMAIAGTQNAPITMKFMFWGSNFEEQIQKQMATDYQKTHPNVTIDAEIAPTDFQTKLNAMMAAHQLPDMSYLGSDMALQWGSEGHVTNMAPWVKSNPGLANWLPQTYIHWTPDKFTTLSTLECMSLYYNPAMFKTAHMAPPPANAAHAWTWPQFVHAAQELTLDDHGLHPYQKGFDPSHIKQYGVNVPVSWDLGWYPYLISAGADITNAAVTKYTMDSPKAVQAFQDLHDLIWKYHVCPTPTVQKTLPASSVQLQTGQYAMVMDGQWMLLDYAGMHLKFGIGVLPKIGKPVVDVMSGASVVYTSTKYPKQAVDYITYEANPLSKLVTSGLWMPVKKEYYTNPKLVAEWTNNPAHPPEYKTAVVDYVLQDSVGDPANHIKDFSQIDPVIEQNLDEIWLNKKPVKQVLETIGKQIQPMLKGAWPNH